MSQLSILSEREDNNWIFCATMTTALLWLRGLGGPSGTKQGTAPQPLCCTNSVQAPAHALANTADVPFAASHPVPSGQL